MKYPLYEHVEKFVEQTKALSSLSYKEFVVEENLYIIDLAKHLKVIKNQKINQLLAEMANCILQPNLGVDNIKELLLKDSQQIYGLLESYSHDWNSTSLEA